MRSIPLVALALAVLLEGCPIAPDFESDAGIDAGQTDAGLDAGLPDAGPTGNVGAQLTTSTGVTTSLAWNGSDLSNTSIDVQTSAGPSQVTIVANNQTSGEFRLTLADLTAGATTGQVLAVSYQPTSGPDSWSCGAASVVACVVDAALSSYDGGALVGTFSVSFPTDPTGTSAQLTAGTFTVNLP